MHGIRRLCRVRALSKQFAFDEFEVVVDIEHIWFGARHADSDREDGIVQNIPRRCALVRPSIGIQYQCVRSTSARQLPQDQTRDEGRLGIGAPLKQASARLFAAL